jgi:putative endonuclease
MTKGFTSRYNLTVLVHIESYPDPGSAIAREKELKGWRREKKLALISAGNPRWNDLATDWYD